MALQEINDKIDELIQTIQKHKNEVDSLDLEQSINTLLCGLPRDVIYIEWYSWSDIKNMADGINDEPVDDKVVDICMHNLWDSYDIMDSDTVQDIICDSIREHYYKGA